MVIPRILLNPARGKLPPTGIKKPRYINRKVFKFLEPRNPRLESLIPLYTAQDFLLCVARSASVYSVVQKIKTLFTTEVTEFTEEEIKDKDFRF